MDKLRIAVCDDEIVQQKVMQALLQKYFEENDILAEVKFYSSGQEYLKEKKSEILNTDIFLLDIFMPELNGIDIGKELKSIGAKGKIIFITAGNDFITEAFEIQAFSYIQKPVIYEKFSKVMNSVIKSFEKTRYMDVVVDREKQRIYLDDIEYVETLGRRLVIYRQDEGVETYLSVKNFMDEYGEEDFLQISRYVAVSKSKIQRIVGRSLYLMNGRELSISEKYLPTTKKLHIEYIHTKKVANV